MSAVLVYGYSKKLLERETFEPQLWYTRLIFGVYIELNICFQIVSYNIDSGFAKIHRIFQTNP